MGLARPRKLGLFIVTTLAIWQIAWAQDRSESTRQPIPSPSPSESEICTAFRVAETSWRDAPEVELEQPDSRSQILNLTRTFAELHERTEKAIHSACPMLSDATSTLTMIQNQVQSCRQWCRRSETMVGEVSSLRHRIRTQRVQTRQLSSNPDAESEGDHLKEAQQSAIRACELHCRELAPAYDSFRDRYGKF